MGRTDAELHVRGDGRRGRWLRDRGNDGGMQQDAREYGPMVVRHGRECLGMGAVDWYHDSFSGAPVDGSSWETPAGSRRVQRGGGRPDFTLDYFRAACRLHEGPGSAYEGRGFRCAR